MPDSSGTWWLAQADTEAVGPVLAVHFPEPVDQSDVPALAAMSRTVPFSAGCCTAPRAEGNTGTDRISRLCAHPLRRLAQRPSNGVGIPFQRLVGRPERSSLGSEATGRTTVPAPGAPVPEASAGARPGISIAAASFEKLVHISRHPSRCPRSNTKIRSNLGPPQIYPMSLHLSPRLEGAARDSAGLQLLVNRLLGPARGLRQAARGKYRVDLH